MKNILAFILPFITALGIYDLHKLRFECMQGEIEFRKLSKTDEFNQELCRCQKKTSALKRLWTRWRESVTSTSPPCGDLTIINYHNYYDS